MQLGDLDFADDLVLLFHAHEGIQVKTTNVAAASTSVDLNTYKGKTKILKYSTKNTNTVTLDGQVQGELETFTYLDNIIGEQGRSDADVKVKRQEQVTDLCQQNIHCNLLSYRNVVQFQTMKRSLSFSPSQRIPVASLK